MFKIQMKVIICLNAFGDASGQISVVLRMLVAKASSLQLRFHDGGYRSIGSLKKPVSIYKLESVCTKIGQKQKCLVCVIELRKLCQGEFQDWICEHSDFQVILKTHNNSSNFVS